MVQTRAQPEQEIQTRTLNGQITAVEESGSGRTFKLSFSSEERVDRGWSGVEILDHSGEIDLSRLNELGVLLYNHKRDDAIGRIDRAWIENGRGYAIVTFDDDELSERILQKVKSGTLRGISVGYRITSREYVEAGAWSTDKRFEGPCTVVRSWTPMELSIVTIPADPTVGVGRSGGLPGEITPRNKEVEAMNLMEMLQRRDALTAQPSMTEEERTELDLLTRSIDAAQAAAQNVAAGADGQRTLPPKDDKDKEDGGSAPTTEDKEKDKEKGARSFADYSGSNVVNIGALQERERQRQIRSMCEDLGIESRQLLDSGASVDEARSFIVEQMRKIKAPVAAAVRVTDDERDKFRRAASDGILLRAGIQLENPAEGARELAGLRMRDLAKECLQMDGVSSQELRRATDDDLLGMLSRAFFNPEAAFPSILDNTIEKAYVDMYKKVPVTYDRFCTKGSLSDFKKHDNYYQQGPVGEFQKVSETGELKHDVFSDAKRPTRELETYGIQFTISRKAFIDDDIGLIASIPGRYAASARKTINKQVFQIMVDNAVIYDGAKLFCGAHKNVLKDGTGVTQDAMQTMILTLAKQTNDFGEPIAISPAKLIVPVGLQFDMYTLFNSQFIETADNTQAVNPLYQYRGTLEVIEDPQINILAGEGNPMPWFLIGNSSECPFLEIDYLNGQETPNLRRSEASGQLGFIYDMWLDWKVNPMDYRGAVMNPGIAVTTKLPLAD